MAVGDLDNDGRLDAVITTNDGPAYILRNETATQNHWLTLLLVGHKSNRDAIGAEIKVVTSHGAQYWTVSTAGSYLSSNDKRAHFGLGVDSVVRSIEIRWPSGIRQTLSDITGDRMIKIDETSVRRTPSEGWSALRRADLPAAEGVRSFIKAVLAMVIFAVALRGFAQKPSISSLSGAPSPANSPKLLADARSLMAAGNFKGAESALRAYLLTEPRSGDARYLLAYTLLRQNNPKGSLEEYTRAAALQAPTAEQLREVGQDYVLLNDTADADKWILRSVEMNGADPEGWYSLGRLRYTEQRFGDALECFNKAIALAPGSVKVENDLGLAYEGLNRTDDAVMAYRQAIAWQDAGPPEKASEQPLLNLATVLLHQGKLAEAQPLLLRAVRIAPKDQHS